ncbi:MAG: 2-C-methyl-D-erythritol 2,4-cyclodiphosphate synthase [Oscillospiraceae bacterium]|nr:2-C-methyl-D-erythritol 2,4-cyclodiphosphate synthase [Oscillospiraceae bacterium]
MLRIGNGYDVHKLKEGRDLILGGVKIEHTMGLDGHSDADVLVHAIMDAILGACALGDIGKLFPDNDNAYLGADSIELLKKVCAFVKEKGFEVNNIDSIVVAQNPKLAPHIETMRKNVAEAMGIDISCVSIKATTEEKLGFTGRQEGISAHAVCLLTQK